MTSNSTILRKMTGERFASVCNSMSMDGRWDRIAQIVSEEFHCRPDDVSIDQGDINKNEPDEQVGLSPDYSEMEAAE